MRGLAVVVALLLGSSACGYGFVRYERQLPGLETLSVRTPSNESNEPGIELIVGEALRREALRRGGPRVVASGADLLLTGEVPPLHTEQTSFSSVLLVLEYRVTLSLRLQVIARDGRPRLPDPILVSESDRYLASPDVEVLRKNREELLRRLATLLAERCFDALYEALATPAAAPAVAPAVAPAA